jgi:hypothetical protein
MWEYKGFIIVNHQDIGYFWIYPKTATAFNVVQSINHFCSLESCMRYIDKRLVGNNQ